MSILYDASFKAISSSLFSVVVWRWFDSGTDESRGGTATGVERTSLRDHRAGQHGGCMHAVVFDSDLGV